MNEETQRRWDLWHLRTLFPTWSDRKREALLKEGAVLDARQQELFADPEAALRRFRPAARRVLAEHPQLARGLTVSLHLGPYSLAPVPWLVAGRDVHVLVNRSSLIGIRALAESLHGRLGLPGRLLWVPIAGRGFALCLARALRRGEPVFAYLDGNDGLDGAEGTLRHGIPYDLPGRRIRVRTGLARLALRLGCPVHGLVTVWNEAGGFAWHRGPDWSWPSGTTAAQAATDLFDWGFGVIRRHPAQWRAWNTLTGVCDSFRRSDADAAALEDARASGADFLAPERRSLPLAWRRPAIVWPGDMLEDVRGQCFYAARGLQSAEVEELVRTARFTPAELAARLGEDWLRSHLPRLVALGFIGPVPSRRRASGRPFPG